MLGKINQKEFEQAMLGFLALWAVIIISTILVLDMLSVAEGDLIEGKGTTETVTDAFGNMLYTLFVPRGGEEGLEGVVSGGVRGMSADSVLFARADRPLSALFLVEGEAPQGSSGLVKWVADAEQAGLTVAYISFSGMDLMAACRRLEAKVMDSFRHFTKWFEEDPAREGTAVLFALENIGSRCLDELRKVPASRFESEFSVVGEEFATEADDGVNYEYSETNDDSVTAVQNILRMIRQNRHFIGVLNRA